MLTKSLQAAKRKFLMRHFNDHSLRYHTEQLGEAMAVADDGHSRKYHHEKIYETIHEICEKNKLGNEDMALIEVALNDFINRRVQTAYERETKKLKARQFVDERIKIKRVGDAGDS